MLLKEKKSYFAKNKTKKKKHCWVAHPGGVFVHACAVRFFLISCQVT